VSASPSCQRAARPPRESGLGDDDIAAEREDLRLLVVRIDHRDLIRLAQCLD
jgi:hypothetical protein